ncbi:VWA domain-containing protein [Cryomorphaceae bacterium]|nr:VWA domain-containing protein [Cryomorphaceae bacterium]
MNEVFEFAWPWAFTLLALPFLVARGLPPVRLRGPSLNLPSFYKVSKTYGAQPRKAAEVKRRSVFSWLILYVIWGCTVTAIAGPQFIAQPELKVKTTRNFLIVADISFSMAQKDWKVEGSSTTRWEALKRVMKDFIEERTGDRMGLLFFGTNAYIQAPFTTDLQTVNQLLDEADVGMAGQMTHIGKAVVKGIELFDRDTLEAKVMLVLTDGIDAGTEIMPLDAAQMALEDSIVIYTVGIGKPDNTGQGLDERTLQDIAELTNGRYFRAEDAEDLERIYEEIDLLEPMEFEEEEQRPITLLYMYPLGLALILLLTSTFIAQFWKRMGSVKSNSKGNA